MKLSYGPSQVIVHSGANNLVFAIPDPFFVVFLENKVIFQYPGSL
jgi:hypothetical protein